MSGSAGRRDAIGRAMEQHFYQQAASLLGQLLREEPTASTASYVVGRFTEMRPHLPLIPCRLAVLRSFTIEPVIPFLQARCFAAGIEAAVHVGGFNTYAQDLLDPGSALYRFEPAMVILAVRTQDVAPTLWDRAVGPTSEELNRTVARTLADFRVWIETFRGRSHAHLVVQTLESPAYCGRGVLEDQQRWGQKDAIERINQGIQHLGREYPGVHVLDYNGLVARYGRLRWHDERRWLTLRMPIAADCLIHLANEYMRFIHPLTGKVCKALAVDLDNTLWGGVVGEDGPQGIQLGPEYPGAAYHACQRAILDLYHRGVILAICSRNNAEDALEVLAKHPDMLLRPEHFAAVRIDWDDKVENLRQIAAELNIGLDALAFLDDNPVERASVRERLPDVHVIDLPTDPMRFAPALREDPRFERLTLSEEDHARGRYYAQQRQRIELRQAARSLQDFYASLQMTAEISDADPVTLPRIAQLTQRTNQFNLTTRRYTEQELVRLSRDPEVRIFTMRLTDRFGDNGIVAAAIARRQGDRWEIDTFLLSCRALGRTAETALLARVAGEARREGAARLAGWYVPTKKNAAAKDFYPRHGFALLREDEEGSLWEFDLTRGEIAAPSWIDGPSRPRPREHDAGTCVAAGSSDRG